MLDPFLDNAYSIIHEVFDRFNCPDLKEEVVIGISNRFKRKIACAKYSQKRIEIGRQYLKLKPNQIREIFIHEACHIVARHLHKGIKPHGTEWQSLMEKCNLNPNRTMNLNEDKE